MYFGKIVELTTSDELFRHPLHPYTKSLLSAIPLPDPHFEKQRKRITYNPLAAHDYSEQQPYMQEVVPGHFIYCNDAEFERYKKEIAELDAAESADLKAAEEKQPKTAKAKTPNTKSKSTKTTTKKKDK